MTAPVCRWTLLLPGLRRPAGGLVAAYELGNALAARGNHVCIAHLPSREGTLLEPGDIPWSRFEPGVKHVFLESYDPAGLPEADLLVYTIVDIVLSHEAVAGSDGPALRAHLAQSRLPTGLPILLVQALGVFPEALELRALEMPAPKVCVAAWIADNLRRAGMPSAHVVHAANGLHHATFHVSQPIDGRAPQIAMNYNPHPLKNMDAGIEALAQVGRSSGIPSVLFGALEPPADLPPLLSYRRALTQTVLAAQVLNRSSLYLQPSTTEGFGLCALEAMACGCALVTTDNGGADDYAIDGETAVLCGPEPGAMAEAIRSLQQDEARRSRISANGARHAATFTWEASARAFLDLGRAYLADPDALRVEGIGPLDPSVRLLAR